MSASKFPPNVSQRSLVNATDRSIQPYTLLFSNLDLLSGRSPVTMLLVYTNSNVADSTTIVSSMKTALSHTLNHYFPFSGRIISNPNTNEPEILCHNQGVELVEVHANMNLASMDFYNLNESLNILLVPLSEELPLQVQITSFTCGGFFISWCFDHIVADATSFYSFLVTWSQVARKESISSYPNHQRSSFIQPRSPLFYDPSFDQIFIKFTKEMLASLQNNTYDISVKRLYFIQASDVLKMQELASPDDQKNTKLEAFSAYLWKLVATSLEETDTHCNMGWLVDGRGRMTSNKDMSSLIGNILSIAVGDASVQALNRGSIPKIAGIVHQAITEVTNEKHFQGLIDWIEHHKPGMLLAKILLGICGPTVVVSSARKFSVRGMDVGFSIPVLGTFYSTITRLGAGYVNPQPSPTGDGSWVVFAMVWPKLAEALESDPNQNFRPITAKQLGFC